MTAGAPAGLKERGFLSGVPTSVPPDSRHVHRARSPSPAGSPTVGLVFTPAASGDFRTNLSRAPRHGLTCEGDMVCLRSPPSRATTLVKATEGGPSQTRAVGAPRERPPRPWKVSVAARRTPRFRFRFTKGPLPRGHVNNKEWGDTTPLGPLQH